MTTAAAMPSYFDEVDVPDLSVYGDGRVVLAGERVGAMLTAREIVDPDEAEALYHAAHNAGFDQDATYSNPDILDGSVVVLRLNSGGRWYTTTAANPEKDHFRVGQLLTMRKQFESGSGPAHPYQPAKVFAVKYSSGKPSSAPAWPLRPFQDRCLMFDASEVTSVADRSTWSVDGVDYQVILRPALPDERSCADLR